MTVRTLPPHTHLLLLQKKSIQANVNRILVDDRNQQRLTLGGLDRFVIRGFLWFPSKVSSQNRKRATHVLESKFARLSGTHVARTSSRLSDSLYRRLAEVPAFVEADMYSQAFQDAGVAISLKEARLLRFTHNDNSLNWDLGANIRILNFT
jgi:hypothetical protein